MSTGPLHDDERRILDEIERALCRDRRLDRRMRRLDRGRRPVPARVAHRRPRTWTVAVLLVVSVCLMVVGIDTSEPAVIWALAAVWPLTLYSAFRLLCAWTEPEKP